jgi:hypothetical protein
MDKMQELPYKPVQGAESFEEKEGVIDESTSPIEARLPIGFVPDADSGLSVHGPDSSPLGSLPETHHQPKPSVSKT